jgi:hypothetical protein
MSEPIVKSRPVYSALARDPTGRAHLLVADGPLSDSLLADVDERWTIVADSRAIPSLEDGARDQAFRSEEHLLRALKRRLSDERMGFRIYAFGAEPFLWAINQVAEDFGLGRREIRLCASGPGPRRVFCNHCRTITEGVTTTIRRCAGCGASLLVRDHFSRRLNAFAGVQVDAEAPGEIPEIEELRA